MTIFVSLSSPQFLLPAYCTRVFSKKGNSQPMTSSIFSTFFSYLYRALKSSRKRVPILAKKKFQVPFFSFAFIAKNEFNTPLASHTFDSLP